MGGGGGVWCGEVEKGQAMEEEDERRYWRRVPGRLRASFHCGWAVIIQEWFCSNDGDDIVDLVLVS